ncbi:MAG: ABC transporter permease subunit [Thermoplasmatota archaeon]
MNSPLDHPVLIIAKKEIMDNIRNKWIIIMTLIFAALTILVSYFGSQGEGWQSLAITIIGMMTLVEYLIPIIGLMLGYAAIVGEIETGSMSAFLSLPVKRFEIILGKFIGLGGVLSFSILIGFGIAGIIIGFNVSDVDYVQYVSFIASSIVLGLVFIALSLFFSSFFKRRSTSMGMSIFLWFFFTMIWGIVMTGIAFMSSNIDFTSAQGFPDWYFAVNMINPLSAYGTLVSLSVGPASMMEEMISNLYPDYYTPGLMAVILFIWMIVFIFLSIWWFKKRDL